MRRWKKRISIVLLLAGLGTAAGWLSLDPSGREVAQRTYLQGMAALGLATGEVEGETFWCPMHPEIRRSGPGTCPI